MQSPILADSIGRKLQYGDDGVLRFVKGDRAPGRPADVPQTWRLRVLATLMSGASKLRWGGDND